MTPQTGGPVKQLSREAEITREQLTTTVGELNHKLADTIDDLRDRLSPSHIKSEFQSYVREESSEFLASIQRTARENPLQAVAVGAAIIYPFWGFLKSIPVPVLLIGGGLLVSKNKAKISEAITESAGNVANSIHDIADSVNANVGAAAGEITSNAHDILEAAKTTTGDAGAAIKEASAAGVEKVSASVSDLGDAGTRVAAQSRTTLENLVYKNPLLFGGIALAVGAFVAASIPITGAENKLFGERSGKVKDKALGAVSDGVERAKDVAAEIVGDVAEAAAREGLTKDGLSKTIEGAATAVRSVVDTALTTALGDNTRAMPDSDIMPETQV